MMFRPGFAFENPLVVRNTSVNQFDLTVPCSLGGKQDGQENGQKKQAHAHDGPLGKL